MIFSCLEEKKSLLNFYLEYIFFVSIIISHQFQLCPKFGWHESDGICSVRSSASINPMRFASSEVRLA